MTSSGAASVWELCRSVPLFPGPLTRSSSTSKDPVRSNRFVWKLLVLDKNNWYYKTGFKLFVLRIVTWNYYCLQLLSMTWSCIIRSNRFVWKLLVLDKNNWYYKTGFKLFVLRIVTWNYYCLQLLSIAWNTWNTYNWMQTISIRLEYLKQYNYIWWWGSSSKDLGSVEYPFTGITPRFTLTWSGRTC